MNNYTAPELDKPSLSGLAFSGMTFCYILILFFGQEVTFLAFGRGSFWATLVNPLFSAIALGLGCAYILKKAKAPFRSVCGLKKFNPLYALVALALSTGMMAGLGWVNVLFSRLMQNIGLTINSAPITLNGVGQYAGYVITFAVFPAILEEGFFRGGMQYGFKGVNALVTSLAVSLCFCLYHLSLGQLIYQFIYGVFLSLLTAKSGSVIPAVISHFFNNFAILTLELLGVVIDLLSPYVIAVGIALILGVTAFLYLFQNKKTAPDTVGVKGFFAFGGFGMAVCILTIILGAFAV